MEYKHLAWLAAAAAVLMLGRLALPPAAPEAPFEAAPAAPGHASAQPAMAANRQWVQQPAAPTASIPAPAAPAGLSNEQWRQLQTALADHPQRDAEIARIAAYLAYMQTAQRFQQLRAQVHEQAHEQANEAAQDELKALARTLQAGLDEHLARGEMSAAEALQLRAATLDVLEPDRATRQTLLAAWRDGVVSASARAPDPRESDFAQQQAALVAQWSAQPAAQRDPRALEAQLDALRQRIFSPPR